MELKSSFIAILLVIVSGCNQSSASDAEFFGANFSLSSCVKNAGDANALNDFMTNGMKIDEQLPPELSKHFLNGSDGKAWSFNSRDRSYAVTYRNDDICTVFIKETDVYNYISHMNDSIKRISEQSGWKFTTSKIPMFAGKNELKTYEFSVELPDKNVKVVMSAVTQVTENFQVAFSTSLL